ncbi:MAG TPA: shikimate kinase [Clostridiales bacterium]|nr:shikimate kinase [Clostridiales bacterium]
MGKNIVLCGFMGSGKTTVGKALAVKLNLQFIDMDSEIERIAGMAVSEIFEIYGEDHFRKIESDVCRALGQKQDLVIASGGGALLKPENQRALSENGIIVFLDVPAEIIIKRLEHDSSRPLLNRQDKAAAIHNLMRQRLPIYQSAADFAVNGEGSAEEVADRIISNLKF